MAVLASSLITLSPPEKRKKLSSEEDIAEGSRMIMAASEKEIDEFLDFIHSKKKPKNKRPNRKKRLFHAIEKGRKKRSAIHAQHIQKKDRIEIFEKLQLRVENKPKLSDPVERIKQWLAAKAAYETLMLQLR